jgi:uncharacterized protein (TIGR00369 family)
MRFLDRLHAMARGELPAPPVAALVGFRFAEVTDGQVVLELDTAERHFNAVGTVHGGVLCDVADAAMGLAFGTTLDDGESFTTVELKINYLRPVWKTRLRAVGRVVKGGRTLGLTECDVLDADGKLVARASSTCMVLRGDQARGR